MYFSFLDGVKENGKGNCVKKWRWDLGLHENGDRMD